MVVWIELCVEYPVYSLLQPSSVCILRALRGHSSTHIRAGRVYGAASRQQGGNQTLTSQFRL